MKHLKFSLKEDSIGWLEWDQAHSSVNLLSLSFLEELSSILKIIHQTRPKVLVLVSNKAHNFCAGADIKEIQKQSPEEISFLLDKAHSLFLHFEELKCFKVAVIQGACLGGGLEWILGFDYRLAEDSPKTYLALPEVKLGLIPGLGGCFRLPRLIGLKQSINMILTGKTLKAHQAKKIGLVDELIPPLALNKRALELAQSLSKKQLPKPQFYKDKKPYLFLLEKVGIKWIGFLAQKQILKKTKGFYPAPLKALKVIEKSYGQNLSLEVIDTEKKVFCELIQTPESKNLIRLFLLMEKAKNLKTYSSFTKTEKQDIQNVAVLGAGVMGRSIAWTFANKGFKVRLIDNKEEQLCSALSWIQNLWDKEKQKEHLNSYEIKKRINNLSLSSKLWGLSTFDLVIEALPENKKLKKELISQVSKKLKPHCLFASNSSSLSLSDLSQASHNPNNFLALHFFNPAHKMPLVELGLRDKQKDFPLTSVIKCLKRLEKTPLLVKDSPGLVVNRLLTAYLLSALTLYDEGLPIERIDSCYRDQLGMPLGPFQLMDKVGLDVCSDIITQFKAEGLAFEGPPWIANLAQTLGLGDKEGRGFYISKTQNIFLNPQTKSLPRKQEPKAISDQEIIEQGIQKMLDEGKKLLKEKIVEKPEDIDLALILGAGFPPFLGGPMNYAKHIHKETQKP